MLLPRLVNGGVGTFMFHRIRGHACKKGTYSSEASKAGELVICSSSANTLETLKVCSN